jgi:hypothetical protein
LKLQVFGAKFPSYRVALQFKRLEDQGYPWNPKTHSCRIAEELTPVATCAVGNRTQGIHHATKRYSAFISTYNKLFIIIYYYYYLFIISN